MASPSPRHSDDSSPSSPLLPSPTSPDSHATPNGSGRDGGPLGQLLSLRGTARFLRRPMVSTSPWRSDDSSPSSPSPTSPNSRSTANGGDGGRGPLGRLLSLRGAARFLRHTGSQCIMRETAAKHLKEHHTDWAYSKPIVVLDVLWNLAFVASLYERPAVLLWLWLAGYMRQCLLHVLCVAVEYRHRWQDLHGEAGAKQEGAGDVVT